MGFSANIFMFYVSEKKYDRKGLHFKIEKTKGFLFITCLCIDISSMFYLNVAPLGKNVFTNKW